MAGPKDGGGEKQQPRERARERRVSEASGPPRIRQPAVAGLFYPAQRDACLAEARDLLRRGAHAADEATRDVRPDDPHAAAGVAASGAVVPHAGWICSGAVAAESIAAIDRIGAHAGGRAIAEPSAPDLVVVFGAVHTPLEIEYAALDTHTTWAEPFEESQVAVEVRARLLEEPSGGMFRADDRFHRREHAVEVELPLIEVAWPGVAMLPVEVPAVEHAWRIGVATARQVVACGFCSPVFLASSDLTHYGPAYGYAPGGAGLSGLAWARDNDRRLLERVERYDVEQIVPEARQRLNACGAGAIAAMLAACRELGAKTARVLRHANSYETLSAAGARTGDDSVDNAVGYASVVVW